jgi:hypothetical protein
MAQNNVQGEGADVRALIRKAVEQLQRSETGRSIRRQLWAFLDGRISNADADNWQATQFLIGCYQAGFAGTVLDALMPRPSPATGSQ